jgi:hypothetical protein
VRLSRYLVAGTWVGHGEKLTQGSMDASTDVTEDVGTKDGLSVLLSWSKPNATD